MAWRSRLTDARLDSLYDADGFGGEKTMRARVVRELIDEIRALRRHHGDTREGSRQDLRPVGRLSGSTRR